MTNFLRKEVYHLMKKILIPGLLAGVAMTVTSLVVGQIISRLFNTNQEYVNSQMYRPWSDPLMMLYFLYPFILGLSLSYLWDNLKLVSREKKLVNKALNFAIFYFLIASFPGMFITYSSFAVSFPMILSWSIAGFAEVFVGGLVLGKIKA